MNYENIIKILENYTSSSQQSYLKMKSFMCIKFKSNFYGIRFERNHVPETTYVKQRRANFTKVIVNERQPLSVLAIFFFC